MPTSCPVFARIDPAILARARALVAADQHASLSGLIETALDRYLDAVFPSNISVNHDLRLRPGRRPAMQLTPDDLVIVDDVGPDPQINVAHL